MREKAWTWDEVYEGSGLLWGVKPDGVLTDYAGLVPAGKVLDLGIGEGRNALFFARLGYEVEGFDGSKVAIERCRKRAEEAGLKLRAEAKDMGELNIPQGTYSLIIAAWVLNFFREEKAKELIQRMKRGLKQGGLLYIAVFSTEDPAYERSKGNLKPGGKNTFHSPCIPIHYFTKGEIQSLFPKFKTISFTEGFKLDINHGQPHYHGFIVYLGQRLA